MPSPKPAYHAAPSKRESYFSAIDGGRRWRSGLGLRLRVASLRSRSRSRWRFSRSCSRSRPFLSRRSRRSKLSRPRSRSRSSRRRGGLRERDRRGLRGLPRRPRSSTRSLMSSTGHPMPSGVGPFVHAEVCRSEERLTESAAASSLTFRHRGRACAWDRGVRGESKRTGGYTRLYNQTGSAVGEGRSKVEPINGSAASVVIVRGRVMVGAILACMGTRTPEARREAPCDAGSTLRQRKKLSSPNRAANLPNQSRFTCDDAPL